jgi:hypothetical protein
MTGLKVSGNKIVNGEGQTIKIVGVNRSGFEYQCAHGQATYNDGPVNAAAIADMLTWNINTVRVPFNEDCWLGLNGMDGPLYQTNYTEYIELLTAAGLAVIVDLHWTETSTGGLADGQEPMPDGTHGAALWTSVANAFKSYSNVIFDLFNEPYTGGTGFACPGVSTTAWNCWLNGGSTGCEFNFSGMATMLNAVRATGATNVVMLGGLMYAGCVDLWATYKPTDPLNNLVVSVHLYEGNTCDTTTCWSSTWETLSATYPVILGEIGEYDCATSYITSVMAAADALTFGSVGYLAWAWNDDSCSSPALITDYSGDATAFGLGFEDHIEGMVLYSSGTAASATTTTTHGATTTTHGATTTTTTTTHGATTTTTATHGATSTSTSTHAATTTSTAAAAAAATTGSAGSCSVTVSFVSSDIIFTNSGSSEVIAATMTISGTQAWTNLVLVSGTTWEFPTWENSLAVGGTFYAAGYTGTPPSITNIVATC